AAADRLDLGAGQRNAGLDGVLDGVVEARLAIFRDDLDRALAFFSQVQLFFRRSRISVSNTTSALGFGGSADFASSGRWSRFTRRMTMNGTKATIRKFKVSVMKLP